MTLPDAAAVYAADALDLRRAVMLEGGAPEGMAGGDAMTALFHRPSGITHLVTSPVPELLDALADGPADAATLLARLAARYDVADADPAAIEARMAELVSTGLARRG